MLIHLWVLVPVPIVGISPLGFVGRVGSVGVRQLEFPFHLVPKFVGALLWRWGVASYLVTSLGPAGFECVSTSRYTS